MAQSSFSSQVKAWIKETKKDLKEVRDEAVKQLIFTMQTPVTSGGNLPVDTQFLRSSLVGTTGNEFPELVPHPGGTNYEWDESQTDLVIYGSSLSDTLTFVYTAEYAYFQEMGTRYMTGHRFVGLAVQQWPSTMARAAKEHH